MMHNRTRVIALAPLCFTALAVMLAATPVHAQYKVIGPDGKVTYTDRQPTAGQGKVTSLATPAAAPSDTEVQWPRELREPVARYPVTLYTIADPCEPCESARRLLRDRGVPFGEKQVRSTEDSEALQRLTGGRDAPTLTIGSQAMRGLAPEVWNSYLDAAGYPRESKLPSTYKYPPAVPVTERREAQASPPPVAGPSPRADPPATPRSPVPENPAGIRF